MSDPTTESLQRREQLVADMHRHIADLERQILAIKSERRTMATQLNEIQVDDERILGRWRETHSEGNYLSRTELVTWLLDEHRLQKDRLAARDSRSALERQSLMTKLARLAVETACPDGTDIITHVMNVLKRRDFEVRQMSQRAALAQPLIFAAQHWEQTRAHEMLAAAVESFERDMAELANTEQIPA